MKATNRRRQLFLFLAALILPCLVLIGFGVTIISYERELSEKRAAETRSQAISDIRQGILSRLEQIKVQELSANPQINAPALAPSDPAVALVAWIDGTELRLPWDRDPHAAQFRNDIAAPEFARMIEAAEADPRQAIPIYQTALRAARNRNQSAEARFRLARAAERAGMRQEAQRQDRKLLALPTQVVDHHGMPFAFYAADRLLNVSVADQDVVARLRHDFEFAHELLPVQASFLRAILTKLPGIETETAAKLLRQISRIKQAINLQHDFKLLELTPQNWIAYGEEPWLLGVSPRRPEGRNLLVAVRSADIFRAVETQHLTSGIRVTADPSAGDPLGENLPGLRVQFGNVQADSPYGTTFQWFYVASLITVLGLTLLGGFLVWRDTQRELRLGDLRAQFVSNVSHELKTPLTSIRMFAEALQMRGLGSDERKREEYLEIIVNESERLTRLLNNVLDFSRIERGQKNYQMAMTNLAGVVDDAARTMHYPLARMGFDLRLDVATDIPPAHIDRDAIEQAILNLLSNAMKYSGPSRTIDLRLARQNSGAVIEVSDHGVGIPKTEHARIFEKYYRAPTAENRAIAGTGLGLALVAHIAAAHGGRVAVESEPGQGSTFAIFLPLNGSRGSGV